MSVIPGSAPRFERSDVRIGLIASLAFGLAALIVGAPAVLFAAYPQAARLSDPEPPKIAAEPRLQINSQADLQAFRRTEDERLNSYGWSDRAAGHVHIPINRALDLVMTRGLQGWPR